MTMKLVCDVTINGTPTLKALAASSNLDMVANAVKTLPGVGRPFLFFETLPGVPTLANWDLHPDWAGNGNVVNADASKNRAMIDAMLATLPLDALTF